MLLNRRIISFLSIKKAIKTVPSSKDATIGFLSLSQVRLASLRSEVLIQITDVDFHSCSFIRDQSISTYLLAHELIETMDLRDCNVTFKILPLLTKHFPRLTTLHLGQTEHKIEMNKNLVEFFPKQNFHSKPYLIKPKLRFLSLEGIYPFEQTVDSVDEVLINSLIQSSEQLRFLDLSRNVALDNLNYIDCFKQVHSLILYDIAPKVIEASIEAISQLKTLVLLDLSYNRRTQDAPNYTTPTLTLAKLVRSLSRLLSLDISGTNLGGNVSFDQDEELVYFRKVLSIDEHESVERRNLFPSTIVCLS